MSVERAVTLQAGVVAWREQQQQQEEEEAATTQQQRRIQVYARLRPVLSSERLMIGKTADRGGVAVNEFESVSKILGKERIEIHEEGHVLGAGSSGDLEHRDAGVAFDGVFEGDDTKAVYEKVVAPLALRAKDEKATCCAIMYGQTNSGKTFTAVGVADRAVRDLIDNLEAVTFVEIGKHNRVNDLFDEKSECQLFEDRQGGIHVHGASQSTEFKDADDVLNIIKEAGLHRATRATKANAQSSRSHSVLTLTLKTGGSLMIVDLAGSERRQEALFDDHDAMEETKAINTALSALKDCIRALLKHDSHVPFRGSALTRILKCALLEDDVDAKKDVFCTAFIAHLAPTNLSMLHTKNTLDYCKKMKDVSTDDDKRKMNRGPEKWTANKVNDWIQKTFDDTTLSSAFVNLTGKALATMYRGELVRRVEAVGFHESKADEIYDAFYELNKKFKANNRKVIGGNSNNLRAHTKPLLETN